MSRRKLPGQRVTRRDGSSAWRLPYQDPETGRWTSRTFNVKTGNSPDSAETFYDELRTAARTGTWVAPDAGRERFVDFAATWAEAQDWAHSTRESFGSHLRRLGRYLGSVRLDQVDQLRLTKLRSELVRDYAINTATISLHYATTVMRTAYETRRIPRDVTLGIKPPVRRGDDADHPVGPDDVPTRDDVLAIIAATPSRHRAIVVLGACGLRISEAIGTTVGQLDLERRRLTVDRQLVRIEGRTTFKRPKREKVRTISLPSWAVLELRRHLRDDGPFWAMKGHEGDLLFRGGRDAPFRRDAVYDSVWKPALRDAGLTEDRYVFHSLRHWCASSLLSAGAPTPAVAGHLGDVPETVMRTYAHWLRDERDLPAVLLDQMLATPTPREEAR